MQGAHSHESAFFYMRGYPQTAESHLRRVVSDAKSKYHAKK